MYRNPRRVHIEGHCKTYRRVKRVAPDHTQTLILTLNVNLNPILNPIWWPFWPCTFCSDRLLSLLCDIWLYQCFNSVLHSSKYEFQSSHVTLWPMGLMIDHLARMTLSVIILISYCDLTQQHKLLQMLSRHINCSRVVEGETNQILIQEG